MNMKRAFYKSDIGNLEIVEENNFIIKVGLIDETAENDESNLLEKAILQLDEYFLGKRKIFDLPIKFNGTAFQNKVWKELMNIPYGTTKTYKEIAALVENPKACRAVGNANNKNSIIIIIPCHRVIGSNQSLVGYALGLDIKEKLLNLEKI